MPSKTTVKAGETKPQKATKLTIVWCCQEFKDFCHEYGLIAIVAARDIGDIAIFKFCPFCGSPKLPVEESVINAEQEKVDESKYPSGINTN